MLKILKSLGLVVALFGVLAGGARADVVVSSKIDTEGTLLGNIILLVLDANGIKTQDRITLGGTPSSARRSPPARSTSIPSTPATPASSSTRPTTRLWKDARARATRWPRSSTTTPTRSSG